MAHIKRFKTVTTAQRMAAVWPDGEPLIDTTLRAAGQPYYFLGDGATTGAALADTIGISTSLETNRDNLTPGAATLLATTDERRVYLGDNATAGGNEIAYRRLNFVDNLPTVNADPAAPGAGLTTEPYYHSVEDRWKYREGTNAARALIGLNTEALDIAPMAPGSGEVSSNVGVHGSFDLITIKKNGANSVEVAAQGVQLKSIVQYDGVAFARPVTLPAAVTVNIPVADGWYAIHMHSEDAVTNRTVIADTSVAAPTLPTTAKLSAFLGWVRVTGGVVRPMQQMGRLLTIGLGASLTGTTMPTTATLWNLAAGLVPPTGIVEVGGRFRFLYTSDHQVTLSIQPNAGDLLGRFTSGYRPVYDPTTPATQTNGGYLIGSWSMPLLNGRNLHYLFGTNPSDAPTGIDWFIDLSRMTYRG